MQKNDFSHLQEDKITKSFGFLPNRKEVFCYTLTNKNGVEFSVINYGATITSLKIPTSNGDKTDVVLGFENIENYIKSFHLPSAPYLGTVVGRYAGRIHKGHFVIGENHFLLNKNHNENHLHGGKKGLSKILWEVIEIVEDENPSITLACLSLPFDDNYPGELYVEVTYTLTENNELVVNFTAKSTEDTIVNLTQHSYFNLDGHSEDIINQELFINAEKILETTNENIPTGKFIDLENHDFNFSKSKKCPTSIDSTFVLDKNDDCKASLFSLKNNLKMSVYTNQPAVHIYVGGNCFDQIKGKENTNYHTQSGICFETQNFPDAPNHAHFPNAVLKKGEQYNHQTTFKFENI
jgi:aldose 1-epimerase